MKKINALSLFDGMGCLGIALKDLGVEFNYFTSEIDKHAIAQSKLNFPDSTQLGDVTKWKEWDIDWSKIDIIGSGSPCQGFSFAGKQLAFDDPRSALFFVFVEILEHTKKLNPNVIFLLENVKMKKEHELVITKYMGVAPIEINAALVSAQNRRRLFWTNIKNEPYGLFGDMQCTIPQPKDRGILLKDILENDVPEKYYLSDKMLKYFSNRAANFNQGKVNIREEEGKASTITASMASCDISDNFIVASRGRNEKDNESTEQQLEPRNDGKTNCITSVQKDNLVIQINPSKESGGLHSDMDLICIDTNGRQSKEKTGTLPASYGSPDNYSSRPYILQLNDRQQKNYKQLDEKANTFLSTSWKGSQANGMTLVGYEILIPEATKKGYTEVNPGECFDFTLPTSETRRGRLMENKSNCLTAAKFDFMQYTQDFKIRRLTPTECARLQSIPSWYKWNCSDSQAYKMCGNGWNVEVIKHILQHALF
jgi:site-specific DNA-cytosine methylase